MLENRRDNRNFQTPETRPHYSSAQQSAWVVIADKRRAVVFAQHLRHFHFVYEINKKDKAIDGLDNEGIGRGGNYNMGRHGFTPSMDESRQEECALAKDISVWLEQQLQRDRFKQLVLVAAPQMLGEIRKGLSKQVMDTVIAQADKDLTNHNESDLTQELLKIIPGPDRVH